MIDPADAAFTITPSNTDDLTHLTRALWVGGVGDVKVMMGDNSVITISGVQAGTLLPIILKRVYSTGTTATLMVGFY